MCFMLEAEFAGKIIYFIIWAYLAMGMVWQNTTTGTADWTKKFAMKVIRMISTTYRDAPLSCQQIKLVFSTML
jgi:hypothetical protein